MSNDDAVEICGGSFFALRKLLDCIYRVISSFLSKSFVPQCIRIHLDILDFPPELLFHVKVFVLGLCLYILRIFCNWFISFVRMLFFSFMGDAF